MTDYYELTMLQGYINQGIVDQTATFELFFRTNPFSGGYAVSCGQFDAVKFLKNFKFTKGDIEYLRQQQMFDEDFFDYLSSIRFQGSVQGVREGTLVFANEPIMTISGRLGQLQLVESALLNIVNFQTLIATKAARICYATKRKDTVLEFGLRRAQGDGALAATRASIIGGCVSTSNTLAGKLFNIPVAGTQAHSWVQSFSSELDAFKAYADTYPDSTVVLVDTYDTMDSGIPNAIKTAKYLEDKGKALRGIRIDSGDLGWLAVEAAKLLDKEGLFDVKIVLSSDLDEYIVESIVNQVSAGIEHEDEREFRQRLLDRLVWGIGTKLVTGSGNENAALGGVYKLVHLENNPVIKISDNREKTTNPGKKELWRLKNHNQYWVADVMTLEGEAPPEEGDRIYHLTDPTKFLMLENIIAENLYVDLMEWYGRDRTEEEVWKESRSYCYNQLYNGIDPTHLRFLNPHIYKISLSEKLYEMKQNYLRDFKR